VVTSRTRALVAIGCSLLAAAAAAAALAVPAHAQTPEDKFVDDIRRSNSVTTTIPGTPTNWISAGWTSCNRISSAVRQGSRLQPAINNEVIAAKTFNVISQQDATALVTYAILDLCPYLIPDKNQPDGGTGN
jgi:hypothetical protein